MGAIQTSTMMPMTTIITTTSAGMQMSNGAQTVTSNSLHMTTSMMDMNVMDTMVYFKFFFFG